MALSLLGLFPAIKDGGKTNTEAGVVSSARFTCSGEIIVDVDDASLRQFEIGVKSACVFNLTSEVISVKDTDNGQGGTTYYLDPNDDLFLPADSQRPDRLLVTEAAN